MRKGKGANSQSWAETWAEGITTWNERRTRQRGAFNSRQFWNGFDIWEEYESYTGYPGRLLEPLLTRIDENTTVLDIGAGTGSIALPLARKAKWVTALEPASGQARRLEGRARAASISNLTMLEDCWEEVELSRVGPHDIVVASYSLFMTDIVPSLRKMCEAALQAVFLVHLGRHDLQGAVRTIKRDVATVPGVRILLGVLEEMGVRSDVRIFRRSFELPLDLQLGMFRYAQGFSDEETASMKTYLTRAGHIFSHHGSPWVKRRYWDTLILIRQE